MDKRRAILYFSIRIEDYNIEEDAANGDSYAANLISDVYELLRIENQAVNKIAQDIGMPVWNEGHDEFGALVCKIGIESIEDLRSIKDYIDRSFIGGDDNIEAAPYTFAGDFRFYPSGVNDEFYGAAPGAIDEISEYIEAYTDSK